MTDSEKRRSWWIRRNLADDGIAALRRELTPLQRDVLHLLVRRTHGHTREWHEISIVGIAQSLNASRGEIPRALSHLLSEGLVEARGAGARVREYRTTRRLEAVGEAFNRDLRERRIASRVRTGVPTNSRADVGSGKTNSTRDVGSGPTQSQTNIPTDVSGAETNISRAVSPDQTNITAAAKLTAQRLYDESSCGSSEEGEGNPPNPLTPPPPPEGGDRGPEGPGSLPPIPRSRVFLDGGCEGVCAEISRCFADIFGLPPPNIWRQQEWAVRFDSEFDGRAEESVEPVLREVKRRIDCGSRIRAPHGWLGHLLREEGFRAFLENSRASPKSKAERIRDDAKRGYQHFLETEKARKAGKGGN